MPRRRPTSQRIRRILPGFILSTGVLGACLASACSRGESGLVLGRPFSEPDGQAGDGALSPGGSNGGSNGGAVTAGGAGGVAGSSLGAAGAQSAGAPGLAAGGGAGGDSTGSAWVVDRCTPTLQFQNLDDTAQGQLFTDAVPDPSALIVQTARDACRLLFRSADEVPEVANISLVVEDFDGIATISANTVRLSTRHLQAVQMQGADMRLEITGVLHFAVSLVYQNGGSSLDSTPPNWLIVGIADFVRLESGYLDRGLRMSGGSYDGGSQLTAFFLDYLSHEHPDIVHDLNQRLSPAAPAWSNDAFTDLTGSDIDTLWAEYQASF